MKHFKKISFALILVIVFIISANAALIPPVHTDDNATPGFRVKAKVVDGELIPVVDLPVVEIVGLKLESIVVKGVIRDGGVVILSNLPEIEISAKRVNAPLRNYEIDSDIMLTNDLPLVEITADFPLEQFHLARMSKNTALVVIELPEFEVTASRLTDVTNSKPWITFIGSREIETKAFLPGYHPQSNSIETQARVRQLNIQGSLFVNSNYCTISESRQLFFRVLENLNNNLFQSEGAEIRMMLMLNY